MNQNAKRLLVVAIEAAKETPRGYFAPLIALLRWMTAVTESVMEKKTDKHA